MDLCWQCLCFLICCLGWSSEKAMAPQSSTLAWKIPWMEEPGRMQSMGLLTVRHDWVTSLSLFTFMLWRRKWQPSSWTRLSDFPFTFHFHALEKEMATHSSILAWRIPGTGEPGGLPSMGLHRVGHGWSDLAAEAAASYTNHYLILLYSKSKCEYLEKSPKYKD